MWILFSLNFKLFMTEIIRFKEIIIIYNAEEFIRYLRFAGQWFLNIYDDGSGITTQLFIEGNFEKNLTIPVQMVSYQ